MLGQAPISTTALQKLHKSLAKSAENLREILEREGERERERYNSMCNKRGLNNSSQVSTVVSDHIK